MSLRFNSKFKKKVLFDTVEKVPSAGNYGSSYQRVNSSTINLYNSEQQSLHEDKAITPRKSPKDTNGAAKFSDIHIDNPDQDDTSHHSDDGSIDEHDHDHGSSAKFGTFDGVFGRCLLCMWGVIMFLRTGWIVGNAGIWQATLVMILSASITMFTTLSLSAICTNGEISHGGPYFLISRSLGPQFGGVIGLLFAVGNCVGVALHLVGFSEAIVSLYCPDTANLNDCPSSFAAGWDIVLIAELGLFILLCLALRGVGCIIKFNLLLLALMIISIIVFFIGTFIPSSKKTALGFTGFSSNTFSANWNAAYMKGQTFLTMVAIFFPSVTGCMAGANISGDLKKPSVNIPVGTIAAVIFSMLVYIAIAWVLGATVVRELVDENGKYIDGTGLYHNYVIMSDISAFRPLVDMGIYASTFSSATSCLVAAPRIFKAVCDDGLFPIFNFFAVGRKSDNEPVRCYLLVVVICALVMLTGDINFIAPMVTNFFLITYALVNYSVFQWDISKSPGWRPSFKYYSKWIALFATVQAIGLMFLIDWAMALITTVIGIGCYFYIGHRDVATNWGTVVESALYLKGCKIALKYQKLNTEHAKITRPTFLILYNEETHDEVMELYKLAKHLNYSKGLIFIGNVMIGSLEDADTAKEYALKRKCNQDAYDLPSEILSECIMETVISESYESGAIHLLQTAGMGGMKPNVFLIRIDLDKESDDEKERKEPVWIRNLRNALLTGLGVIMIPNHFSFEHLNDAAKNKKDTNKDNTIDIWWLFDDGGLTILSGYLLTKYKEFKDYKLRIMALDEIGFEDTQEMVYLMNKLRIKAHIEHVHMDKESEETLGSLQNINVNMKEIEMAMNVDLEEAKQNAESSEGHKRKVSEFAHKKMRMYRRVGKTIEKYSKDAALCLITMPYPRKKFNWWEYSHIIHDLTPQNVTTMFIRGTQEQVLTFQF